MNRRPSLAALAMAMLLLVIGCSPAAPQSGTSFPPGVTEGPAGTAFYSPPTPAPGAVAGDLVWARTVEAPSNADGYLILYWSTGLDGSLVPVSGILLVPRRAASPGTVLAWAHGTAGIADRCAPSRDYPGGALAISHEIVTQTLGLGAAFVATDYRGLGTPRDPPYLVNQAAGRDVLDSVRAAQPFVGGRAATVMMGESEGGGAALVAVELQPTYAPDLDLRGGIGLAVPSALPDLDKVLSGGPYVGFALMATSGYMVAYPELDRLTGKLTDAGRMALQKLPSQCGLEIIDEYAGRPLSYFGIDTVLNSPPFEAVLAQNDPGRPTGVPLLLLHGAQDDTIPVQNARDLLRRYCGAGSVVSGRVIPDGGHQILEPSLPDVLPWIKDRFAGVAAPSSCPRSGG